MCGIFGVFLRPGARLTREQVVAVLEDLYRRSESRGKESAGLHLYLPSKGQAWTLKAAQRATDLLKSTEYRRVMRDALGDVFSSSAGTPSGPVAIMGHSRLVTNGAAERNENNQPVRSKGVTMIHNGIVVNVDALWASHPRLERRAQVDTEVMAALAADALAREENSGAIDATKRVYAEIRGAASIAWTHDMADWAVLATNTGDLYRFTDENGGFTVFASERFILENALRGIEAATVKVEWLPPGSGVVLALNDMKPYPFSLANGQTSTMPRPALPLKAASQNELTSQAASPTVVSRPADESLLRYNEAKIAALPRCSRCVLPDTFPFIAFDGEGVCNYCRNYRPRYRGVDTTTKKQAFIESLQRYRSQDGQSDVLVAFSGGRDSSYGLHLIKKEFGLTPITFTYDWGMVTDLARRNIARVCGKLGIQNILVSADIKKKRENIRKNVSAWLRQPELGMVPLFMAGDKHFFLVANALKRQTGIHLNLWCANPLENTDFKSGFCGVPPDFGKKSLDYLSFGRKMRMAAYYAYKSLENPDYFNDSVLDTLSAFFAYYFEPRRDFYSIFDHMTWNERDVNDLLLKEYDWELAPDTTSTWRIGDGTAPFYNYIYVTARGFSEFDTFRSNQVREGMISREEAFEAVLRENRPRAESLRWYLDAIGLDFNDAIKKINDLDELELHSKR